MTTTLLSYSEHLEHFLNEGERPSKADQRALREVIDILRGRHFLTTDQAAERLDVKSINTVKRLVKDGLLPGTRVSERGTYQIPLAAVERLIKDRERALSATVDNPLGLPKKLSNSASRRVPSS